MRHRVYGKKLSRTSNQRAGLFKSLVQSLFTFGTITTSASKASVIKGMVDKIINQAKQKNTQRLLQAYLNDKLLQERLIKEIAPKLQNRVSGYTSMVKVGIREGDKTTLVKMSLIGLEELKPLEKVTSKKEISKAREITPKEKQTTRKTTPVKTAKRKVSK